eukprot:TRINITY_DN12602_c0_g1_i1.p1 TRINITY_DN12602_c0_g1~~TRINITY_DN12602_c0_g1_i1.p1  ORF type:complete len:111 (-),score=26.03 TRINITY_DN12602_c0_g1_i1:115-408(-)
MADGGYNFPTTTTKHEGVWEEKRYLTKYEEQEMLRSRLLKAQRRVSECYLREGINHALKCTKEVEALTAIMYITHDFQYRPEVDHYGPIRGINKEQS